jgi:hypothetical protein
MFIKGNSDEVLAALTTALSLAKVLEMPYHQMRLSAAHHTFLVRIGDFRRAAAVAEQNEAVASTDASDRRLRAWPVDRCQAVNVDGVDVRIGTECKRDGKRVAEATLGHIALPQLGA